MHGNRGRGAVDASAPGAREELLRRLTLHDEVLLDQILGSLGRVDGCRSLEPRVAAVARLAALVAVGGPEAAFGRAASLALTAGASADDLVDTLVAVAPIVGAPLVVQAAPRLGLGLGYDVEEDLEGVMPSPSPEPPRAGERVAGAKASLPGRSPAGSGSPG